MLIGQDIQCQPYTKPELCNCTVVIWSNIKKYPHDGFLFLIQFQYLSGNHCIFFLLKLGPVVVVIIW